jgi:cell division protein FtsW (lipid II flippase)
MAAHSFSNSCIVLILPFVVAYVAPNNTREEWARILVFVAALVVTAILFFDFTAEASPRPWVSFLIVGNRHAEITKLLFWASYQK